MPPALPLIVPTFCTFNTMKIKESDGSVVWRSTYTPSYSGYAAPAKVRVDAAGNVYVVGTEQTGSLDYGMNLIKYNSSGTMQWKSTYDSTGYYDGGVGLVIGTYISITGFSGSGFGSWDFATATFSPSTGALHDQNRAANGSGAFSRPIDIIKDNEDNLYVLGTSQVSGSNTDLKLIKYDTACHQVWVKVLGDSVLPDVAEDLDYNFFTGKLVITGTANNATGGKDILTAQYDTSGTTDWERRLSNPNPAWETRAKAVIGDWSGGPVQGNVYVAGRQYNGADFDMVTLSYDTGGNMRWLKTYNRGAGTNDRATGFFAGGEETLVIGSSEGPTDTLYFAVLYKEAKAFIPVDTLNENNAFALYQNMGQIMINDSTAADSVLFYTNAGNPQIYVSDLKLSYVIGHTSNDSVPVTDTVYRIDMTLTGGEEDDYDVNKNFADAKIPAYLNYYLGYLAEPITRVEGHNRIVRKGAYPGIDWHTCSAKEGIKNYFVVEPGADGGAIRLQYSGADSTSIDSSNRLTLYTAIGNIEFDSLTAYEVDSTGARSSVAISYQLNGTNRYRFIIGTHSSGNYLVVEQNLGSRAAAAANGNMIWNTYYGGNSNDIANDIKTDVTGHTYITGQTTGTTMPAQGPTYTPVSNNELSFFSKYYPDGLWHYTIIYGGTTFSEGYRMTIVNNDKVIICGHTRDTNFPEGQGGLSLAGYLSPLGLQTVTTTKSYIMEVKATTGFIAYSQLFAGTQNDIVNDASGNLYMVGTDQSGTFFPKTVSTTASITPFNFSAGRACITKFNDKWEILWATRCSATSFNAVTISPSGKIYTVGEAGDISLNFIFKSTTGEYTQSFAGSPGDLDGVIVEFDANDNLLYSSYFGGDNLDLLSGIDASNGKIYICGNTQSTNFPTTSPTSSPTHYKGTPYNVSFSNDGIFAIWDEATNTRYFATYCGGTGDDELKDIVVKDNIAFLTGVTSSYDLQNETPSGYFNQSAIAGPTTGAKDGFILMYDNLNLNWSTYIGGSEEDKSNAIAMSGNGNLYLAGSTKSGQDPTNSLNSFPTVDPQNGAYFQPVLNLQTATPLSSDAFIAKFTISDIVGITSVSNDNSFVIYPNPTNDLLFILDSDLTKDDYAIEIFNLTGQLISAPHSSNGVIDVSNFKSGMYLVNITSKKWSKTAKFIKE